MPYKIQHLLDENEKITTLNSDEEFVNFANLICRENEDDNFFAIHNAQDCKDYINEYCDNLKLL